MKKLNYLETEFGEPLFDIVFAISVHKSLAHLHLHFAPHGETQVLPEAGEVSVEISDHGHGSEASVYAFASFAVDGEVAYVGSLDEIRDVGWEVSGLF